MALLVSTMEERGRYVIGRQTRKLRPGAIPLLDKAVNDEWHTAPAAREYGVAVGRSAEVCLRRIERSARRARDIGDRSVRAAFLIETFGRWDLQTDRIDRPSRRRYVMPLLISAVLENLLDPDLDCIEAAAFYLLGLHEPWRGAALFYLWPRRVEFARWVKRNPKYRHIARLADPLRLLPSWTAINA